METGKGAREVLESNFGFTDFRGEQESIIENALQGASSLVIMPTGSGKSLCYQLPSLMLPGITLVISPLIALMKDQVEQAHQQGLRARYINSSLGRAEREAVMREVERDQVRLLYVTPERFRKKEFCELMQQKKLSLLAIDEAHCISQWGHDFRPDYSRVGEFREFLNNPPTMALTATATPEVQNDILVQLQLDPQTTPRFVAGIQRPNLFVGVQELVGLDQKLQFFIAERYRHPGSAILYFSLIKSLEDFSRGLESLAVDHTVYHGRLSAKERNRNQKQFLSGKSELILATPAFGLGINKSDIRMVSHAEITGSLEAYYQEIGRAGRDGHEAHCFLMFDPDDLSIQMDFIKWANPDPGFMSGLEGLLRRRMDDVRSGGMDYLRQQLNFYNSRDFRVETALNQFERWGLIAWPEKDFRQLELTGELSELKETDSEWKARMENLNQKLYQVLEYARAETCRKQKIYQYFGLEGQPPCGMCDVCHG